MDRHLKQIYCLLLSSLLFFTLLSFTKTGFSFLGFKGQVVDLFSEIRKSPSDKKIKKHFKKNGPHKKNDPAEENPVFITDNDSITGIKTFFASLDKLKITKKKKIRIAHFGDSAIESDLVTAELRKQFQQEYGGGGFGFIGMTSVGPGTRVSSFHNFSKDWKQLNIKEDHKKNYPIALNGYSTLAQSGKNLFSEFSLPKKTYQSEFSRLRIFYGPATEGNKIIVQDTIQFALTGKNPVNEISLKNIHSSKAKISLSNTNEQVVFGYSTESDTGIVVDNFSFRGSSGTWFTRYPEAQLKAWDSLLNYDLIILQYGVNVAQPKIKDYSWYKKTFDENVKYLRKCFPNTTILIVGCADRAVKKNGEYHTLEGIPYLIETQKEIALENNCSFLNLYELMGGEDAMVRWVKNDPPLANKDYTHFTHKGADKAGKILYEAINKEYLRYTNAQAGK